MRCYWQVLIFSQGHLFYVYTYYTKIFSLILDYLLFTVKNDFLERVIFTKMNTPYLVFDFRIDSVRREDRGEYSCTADNQVSAPVSKHFTLKV